MKNKKLQILLLVSVFSLLSTPALAADTFTYPLLEQFPGFFNSGSTPSFPDLVSALYSFGIWTVGIAAFLMLVIGGFMYITSAGNTSSAGTAKKIITDALLGLAAALVAYLILYVINPDLVNLNLNLIKVGINSGGGSYGGGGGSGEIDTGGVGKGQVIDAATKMKDSGCKYSKPKRNSCKGNPAYTDCSNFVCTSYKNAGCKCPGAVSDDYGRIAKTITEPSSLQAGDVLWVPGHVVMCTSAGCKQVIGASGEQYGIKYSNGSYYLNKGAKVVRASDFCK